MRDARRARSYSQVLSLITFGNHERSIVDSIRAPRDWLLGVRVYPAFAFRAPSSSY